ncbi:N-methylproline demethylase [Hoeflea sp. BAL378]|uniref:NADH:flavin oxidoreductase n=1 Tax=Hoeflea sp. BAL378 TaxID=1547437 RepID=UPI000513C302|nr:NADH:flavin oxidoreductase [Hoeflea sp. BAL378]KGF69383.1 N-methylproline demethylase [Hoeflea sp. BAL378]
MTDPVPNLAAKTDPLLQPFRLKQLVLKNRIVSTSHASMLDDHGLPLERYQSYHEEKAKGGVAMTMIGGSAMTSVDSSWGGGQLDLSNDRIIPHLQQLSERIHRHGAAVMTQVSHLGRRATAFGGNWLPALAPSRVRETRNRNFPKEMDLADIERVIRDYAEAAARAMEGGLDGVQTVTGGHLIGQFLSPLTNRRSDAFGGSTENRARFGIMVHEAIRRAVGDRAVVGIRFVINEATEGGLSFEEAVKTAELLQSEGTLDYFDTIYGRMDTDLALSEHNMPGLFQKNAPYLAEVANFRACTKLPLIHAGGIRDVATARHAIRENVVDLVGMTRAHIADPHLVSKIERGEEDRIRPCVGASYCLYKKVHCIHNPSTAHETVWPHVVEPAETRKKVVVIGGGPGGLEAARVSAERGHAVILLEAAQKLGGQVLIAAAASDRRDLIGIVEWRERELARLGVDVRTNIYADSAAVLAESPDAVIVGTGGIPDTEWLEGAELCDTVWDLLSGLVPGKQDILVYDGTGRQAAPSCALDLARKGMKVTIATPDEALAVEMTYQDKTGFRKHVAELEIETKVQVRLIKVVRQGNGMLATFRNELTDRESTHLAQQIIIENGTVPVDTLYTDLRDRSRNQGVTDIRSMIGQTLEIEDRKPGGGFILHRIGDAVASRDVYSAIYEGYRLCSRL